MSSQVQNLSFKRPTDEPKTPKAALAARHSGILQDQLRRYNSTVAPVSSCLSPFQSSTTTMGPILLASCAPSLPSTDIWCYVLQHQRLRRRSEHTRFPGVVLTTISIIVYNFWEPLHFLDQGYGFQTWELSPVYALRSWAYILLHYIPPRVGRLILAGDKVRRNYQMDSSLR